jgi:hypothetical protein
LKRFKSSPLDNSNADFKQNRRVPVQKAIALHSTTTTVKDVSEITKSYSDMHELSRHLSHILETLRAAKNTMKAILDSTDGHVASDGGPLDLDNLGQADNRVKFWAMFVANLELRAGSFNERLENEISLVILAPPSWGFSNIF